MDKRSPKSFEREKADRGPSIDLAYREGLLPQMSIGGEDGGEATPAGSCPVLSCPWRHLVYPTRGNIAVGLRQQDQAGSV